MFLIEVPLFIKHYSTIPILLGVWVNAELGCQCLNHLFI